MVSSSYINMTMIAESATKRIKRRKRERERKKQEKKESPRGLKTRLDSSKVDILEALWEPMLMKLQQTLIILTAHITQVTG
jgi:hypothetical protein